MHNAYMLTVKLYVSATKPIMAGAKNVEQRPIVIKLLIVVGILSEDWRTACLMIKGTKFAVRKPYNNKEKRIIYKLKIIIDTNSKKDPIKTKIQPTIFSLKKLINWTENKFANIPPQLKKIKPKPPKYKGAFKSLVNHNEDQSITIPIDPKIINNNKPNTKTFFSGICSLSPFPLKSRCLGNPRL